ncbi:hypothetical protein OC846_006580 [Tilletia horrida]|uniref:Ysc84 actin-binding domain-containing protein n=1 Tax=Tilletia horrida TaxID=155126 RepID=A0AAN6GJ72_9BASI|nr:hypothetical protein OC846_006580 [Tilletia horrida]KAK0551679.1 hypothetical protein OC845_002094 [Tilletia horrida]KAK0559360.1 hypothetical protein OC861_006669 [Tilletia horrida]
MFKNLKDKVMEAAADPRLDKTKAGLKKAETGLWKALEPVGRWSNRTAGKLGAESFWPTDLALECDKAARILRTFTVQGAQADDDPSAEATGGVIGGATKTPDQLEQERKLHQYDSRKTRKVIKKIPPQVIAQAKGIAIFTVFRTGLGFSGAGGSGVVLKRLSDGSWSGPSGILLHTIGWGFLIGLDIYDVVLVLRTDKAVEAFRNAKVSVGAELSVTAGPVGNGAMVDSGVEASPAFSYVKSKGFYAGLQLDGNIIVNRKDENSRFYGVPDVQTTDVFSGRHPAPKAAYPLLKTIYDAEGGTNPAASRLGADVHVPDGPTPGDIALSQEDAAALEAEAKAHEQQQQQAGTGTSAYPASAGSSPAGGASGPYPPVSALGSTSAYAAGIPHGESAGARPGYGSGPSAPTTVTDAAYTQSPIDNGNVRTTASDPAHTGVGTASALAQPGSGQHIGAAVATGAALAGAGVAGAAAHPPPLPDRKESEVWEQPPPDYDTVAASVPAAAGAPLLATTHAGVPLPVPPTTLPPQAETFPSRPPPGLSAAEEKEWLKQRDAAQAAAAVAAAQQQTSGAGSSAGYAAPPGPPPQ